MNRRRFVVTSLAGALVVSDVAKGQQVEKVARVGILSSSYSSGVTPTRQAFEDRLGELGWTVDRNLILERRFAEGQLDRLPALAQDLVRLKIDVIAAFGPLTIKPARDATNTIPIVMIAVSDPVGKGLVASLARPGGNVTGVTWGAGTEVIGKVLETLKEAIPGATQVAVLDDGPEDPGGKERFEKAARQLELRISGFVVGDVNKVEAAMADMGRRKVDAVYLPMRGFLFNDRHRVAGLAVARRMPMFGGLRELPEAGGLFSYGQSLRELYRHAATFVDKILKGAKPADLPVEQPTKFELVINLKTAKALNLTVPPSLLARADQIIE
jgi:putative tryptophan/tyrosine transport system substrate-binding protein